MILHLIKIKIPPLYEAGFVLLFQGMFYRITTVPVFFVPSLTFSIT